MEDERKPLFLFNQDDQYLGNLLIFKEPYLTEEKGLTPTLEFIVPFNADGVEHIKEENQVVVKDIDGVFRLFIIKELDKSLDEIYVYCVSGMQELTDKLIDDKRPQDVTADIALSDALLGTRYQVGQVASLGTNSTNFYHIYSIEAIDKIVNTWGGEVRDRVEVDETGITGRYIDLLTRRGQDTGHRFEVGQDIKGVNIRIQSYPKTALYGWGASIEYDSGGNSRKIDFADVEWSVANGDPTNKPLGQKWVGDPDALSKWGRLKDGDLIHREGKIEFFDIEDPEELLEQTWLALQEQKEPNVNVQLSVILLGELTGYEHKKVRFGDTVRARIKELDFTAEMRVIKHRYNILDYSDAEVEIGQPLKISNELERLKQMESRIADNSGIWSNPKVDDANFPDEVPPVPTNFSATGLYKIIQLKWDYNPSAYIAAYEIYASQVQGFTPDSSNLVWRGKSGGYAFEAETNQQWYFRIRAVNTHGTSSAYSDEISAQTLQINAETDVQPLTITNELIAENAAIDFAKIANVEITNAMITNVSADKIISGSFEGEIFTGGTFEGQVFNGIEINGSVITGSTVISDDPNSTTRTIIQDGTIRSFLAYGNPSYPSIHYFPDYIMMRKYDGTTAPVTYFEQTGITCEFPDTPFIISTTDLGMYFHSYNFDVPFEFESSWGYLRLGVYRNGEVHFDTDGAAYNFNKEINVAGQLTTTKDIQSGNKIFVPTNGVFESLGGYVILRAGAGIVYLQTDDEVRATAPLTGSTYKPVRASSFPTGSLASTKTDIRKWDESILDKYRNEITIYDYMLKSDIENGKYRRRQGLVIGDGYNTPVELIDGDGTEQYILNSWNIKAIQELIVEIDQLKAELQELKSA